METANELINHLSENCIFNPFFPLTLEALHCHVFTQKQHRVCAVKENRLNSVCVGAHM